jgi:NAD(P)-dependent dehydrogenase (short-subunit alcohol dehydrogenase family)
MVAGQVSGKVALVTGASSGIGAATAQLLAREGAAVVMSDVHDAAGETLAAELRGEGAKVVFLHQDVTSEERWIEIVRDCETRFGRLDILVSNAGIGIGAPVEQMTQADWRRQMAINVDGVFLSCKHAIPAMRRAGGGSIILMSSVAGLRGAAGLAGYSASKGAVRLFGKSLALECAQAGDKIRVNTVHPGIIATPIWNKIPTEAETARRNAPMDPHALAHMVAPLERAGTPEDIARGVLWLASDASSYVTGQELVIDGGMTAGGFFRPPA